MSVAFLEAQIKMVTGHHVGNKCNDETAFYSDEPLDLSDDTMREVFTAYATGPFNSKEEYFRLYHESDLQLNTVYHFARNIFDNPENFIADSAGIARHLYEAADSPNIKGGDVFVVLIDDVIVDGQTTEAIGIFKTENPQYFFKTDKEGDAFSVSLDRGNNAQKMDKGCLIVNANSENGFLVSVVDQTAKKEEARYWRDNFLKIVTINNFFSQTKSYMDVCRHFVVDRLDQEYEVEKPDKIDYLNKTVDYFKKNQTFEEKAFLTEVFADEGVISSFDKFKKEYTVENELEIDDAFEISGSAVKKQSRVFKSVLKLDKNFHVYIHGDKNLIEKGYDEALGKSFYKIYFDNEE